MASKRFLETSTQVIFQWDEVAVGLRGGESAGGKFHPSGRASEQRSIFTMQWRMEAALTLRWGWVGGF